MCGAGIIDELRRLAGGGNGWRPCETWTDFRARRGGGERAQDRGVMTTCATAGGGGSIEGGGGKDPEKWWRQVG